MEVTDPSAVNVEQEPARRIAWTPVLAWVVLFAVAHTQCPLYYSNQNQYFLHGLAAGGLGYLNEDWLANTQDPTPVFSAGVTLTYRYLHVFWFYIDYIVLMGVYFVSLVLLCYALPGRPLTALGRFVLLTALVLIHAASVRYLSVELRGTDYPWYLQSGVAGQYLLGPGLQPSAFGVLLLPSLVAFLRGRPILAALFIGLAATFHATYLLPGAMLTVAYMAVLAWERRWRLAVATGACALVTVLPVVVYSALAFGPTSPAQFAEAQHLFVHLRIPHHAVVSRWLDAVAWRQIAWVALAMLVVVRTRLFPLLAIPAVLSVALTLVQVATDSDTLALVFPWRISAVLVPVATAVILARLIGVVVPWIERHSRGLAWAIGGVCAAALVAATAGSVVISLRGLGYQMNPDEVPVMDYVRDHKQPGDVYLLPVTVPKLSAAPPGSISTSFTPPPRSKPGVNLVPVDLMRFRLYTGCPIYVDFKSMPYKDTDVLEWYRRLEQCQRWYEAKDWDRGVRDEVTAAGVTHVLTTADRDIRGDGLERVYADDIYRVYRLRRK